MAGEERNLAAGDPELWASRASRMCRGFALDHFIERAAKIEVDLAPGLGLEHQDQARAVAVESVLEHGQHVAERTGRDPTRTRERGEGSFGIHAANCTRVKHQRAISSG